MEKQHLSEEELEILAEVLIVDYWRYKSDLPPVDHLEELDIQRPLLPMNRQNRDVMGELVEMIEEGFEKVRRDGYPPLQGSNDLLDVLLLKYFQPKVRRAMYIALADCCLVQKDFMGAEMYYAKSGTEMPRGKLHDLRQGYIGELDLANAQKVANMLERRLTEKEIKEIADGLQRRDDEESLKRSALAYDLISDKGGLESVAAKARELGFLEALRYVYDGSLTLNQEIKPEELRAIREKCILRTDVMTVIEIDRLLDEETPTSTYNTMAIARLKEAKTAAHPDERKILLREARIGFEYANNHAGLAEVADYRDSLPRTPEPNPRAVQEAIERSVEKKVMKASDQFRTNGKAYVADMLLELFRLEAA